MEVAETALEERVRKLLAHLEETPAIAAPPPFTVGYLVDKLRRAITPKMALQSIDLTENELMS